MHQLDDQLWVVEQPFRILRAELGVRSTVVRLPSGELWIHSPVALSTTLKEDLDRCGPVHHLVAPNRMHHLFLAPYLEAYPSAKLYGVQELAGKRRDLRFDAQLGGYAPAAWADTMEQQVIRGIPMLGEVAFFHRASRTLILTDLLMGCSSAADAWTRMFLRLDGIRGDVGVSRLVRAGIRDRGALWASVERLLQWDFDRVVFSHGTIVERGGKDTVRRAFAEIGIGE